MKKNTTWPILDFNNYKDTLETLHQWLQIVGKIRLKTMPWQNHSWHTALYISSNGYTTRSIPYEGKTFKIDFNFINQSLDIYCSSNKVKTFRLEERSVANFYNTLFSALKDLDINVKIHGSPNEMEPAIPFKENTTNYKYDPEQALTLLRAMEKVNAVFHRFNSSFIGKTSPVHLFWGAFDLAITRFSGKTAPLHQGGVPNMPLDVMQEAYSHEVSSAGFWLGNSQAPNPVFYAYAYPGSKAYGKCNIQPKEAFYSEDMEEFFLPYNAIQEAKNPESTLLDFLNSTYEAAAKTSNWDRNSLERIPH